MESVEARPLVRWAAMPGRRAIDSAIEASGSLPMSSADTASTICDDFFLAEMASWIPLRMPVMTTVVLSSAGAADVASWAKAGTAKAQAVTSATVAPQVSKRVRNAPC